MNEIYIAETLRYLGYKGQELSDELKNLIIKAAAECESTAKSRYIWRSFEIFHGENIILNGTRLVLDGNDIKRHLIGCSRAVIMAVTLGIEVDMIINKLALKNLPYSVIFDAAATALTEQAADEAEKKIRDEAETNGLFAGGRFSPGYGDLPISIQPLLLSVINAEKRIGLSCTPNFLMTPLKSVTAVIGLSETKKENYINKCADCNMRNSCNHLLCKSPLVT
jgi:hypothetical protein